MEVCVALLLRPRRPGGIAAQKRFKKVRGETRRIVEEWWSDIDAEVAERDPALMQILTAVYLAFVDGMFVADLDFGDARRPRNVFN